MASASPTSIKSQAYEPVRPATLSPSTAPIEHGFQSQVPFYTQVPHHHSPSASERVRSHVSRPLDEPDAQSQSRRSSIGSQDGELIGKDVNEPGAKGCALNLRQHCAPLTDGTVLENGKSSTRTTRAATEEDIASQSSSIQCEPLDTNFENLATQNPTTEPRLSGRPFTRAQPFPLVEWVRRIREESEGEWPTRGLLWSRSIPKRQRVILDTDDAWSPPLPGREIRQGTVPIELLTKMTDEVDRKAARSTNGSTNSADEAPGEHVKVLNGKEQERTVQSSHASQLSTDEDESGQVQWSSSEPSPRRPRLPPDTSPLRPVSSQTPHSAVAAPSTIESNDRLITIGKVNPNTTQSSVNVHPHFASEDGSTEEVHSKNCEIHSSTTGLVPAREILSQQKVNTYPQVNSSSLAESSMSSKNESSVPGVSAQLNSRVQVKETPYPLKDPLQTSRQSVSTPAPPQSSLVIGTYPESALQTQRLSRAGSMRRFIDDDRIVRDVVTPPGTSSATNFSARAKPLRNRTTSIMEQDDPSSNTQCDSQPDPFIEDAQPLASMDTNTVDSRLPSKAGIDIERTDEGRSPLERKQSLNSSDHSIDSDLRAFNERRIKARRAFYRQHSSRWFKDGVEYKKTIIPEVNGRGIGAMSNASSSLNMDGLEIGLSSEGEPTLVTAQSADGKKHFRTPNQSKLIDRASIERPAHRHDISRLFQRFVATYPDYQGSMKTFISALNLLLRLRLAPHEPHPSLWDDFIYRMASDYPTYLRVCIDEADSAMPYQDYYYVRVKQAEHRCGVVTEQALEMVQRLSISQKKDKPSPIGKWRGEFLNEDIVMTNTSSFAPKDIERNFVKKPGIAGQSSPALSDRLTPVVLGEVQAVKNNMPVAERVRQTTGKSRSLQRATDPLPAPSSRPAEASPLLRKQTGAVVTTDYSFNRPTGASSPEIEANHLLAPSRRMVESLTAESNVTPVRSKHARNLDASTLRLPEYLLTPGEGPRQSLVEESSPPRESTLSSFVNPQTERPVTPFTLFARNFARLQGEEKLRKTSTGRTKRPINVYDW